MVVYLIHFERPLHHAKHYVGWAEDLESRLKRHRSGSGGRLMAAVKRAGIGWAVVRTWDGADRNFERKIKNSRAVGRRYCPICRGEDGGEDE